MMRCEKRSCFFERSLAGSWITQSLGVAAVTYRLRKFARRHRALVIAVVALVVGLAIGLAVTLAVYMSFQGALDEIFGT